MIPFFRKTRKKMADDNKPMKYMRYAIGEIVLVVIGILIALSINNWNEEQKIEKEEIIILNNLVKNLNKAKEQSDYYILKEKKLKQSLLIALGKNQNEPELSIKSISDSLFYELLWNFESNVPVINSYEDIKNTGKIAIIKNSSIRENLSNLELRIYTLDILVKDRLSVQQIRIDDIAVNHVNFVRLLKTQEPKINIEDEISNNYGLILTNPKIRNLLAIKLELTNSTIKFRQDLGREINGLIQLLETELKTREK